MAEVVAPTHSRRLPFWAMIIALVVCALAGVFVLLWFKLPTWAPAWVVHNSPWIDPLLRAVVEDRNLDEEARKRVVEWGDAMKPVLRERLQDQQPAIRSLAAATLGRLKDDVAIDGLVSLMESDKEQECRSEAVEVLGLIGNPRVIPHLVAILRRGSGLLAEASNALIDLPPNDVADALLPLLMENEGDQPRVIRLAGKLDDMRMVPALEHVVRDSLIEAELADIDAMMRTRQVLAASQLANFRNEQGVPNLAALLSDPSETVRLIAIIGLTESAITKVDRQLVIPLIAALEDHSKQIRIMAAITIRQFAISEAQPQLRKMIVSSNPEIRQLAVLGLGSRGANNDTIALLVERVHDHDSQVRASSIVALGETGNPAILDPLLDAYVAADKRSKRAIHYLVTRPPYNREAKAFSYLLLALADSSEHIHAAADRVLRALTLTDEQRRQVDAVIAERAADAKPEE